MSKAKCHVALKLDEVNKSVVILEKQILRPKSEATVT